MRQLLTQDIPNVHILCSIPNGTREKYHAAESVLRDRFPHALSAGCACATPFTEVCGCEAQRADVHVSVSGLNTLPLEAHRKEAFELIADVLQDFFGKRTPIIVRDLEGTFKPICTGVISDSYH